MTKVFIIIAAIADLALAALLIAVSRLPPAAGLIALAVPAPY